MHRLLGLLILIGTITLQAESFEKKKKRFVGSLEQKDIVYVYQKSAVSDEKNQKEKEANPYYFGIETQYATGTQTENTRLSSNFYRKNEEAIIYNELSFKFGLGEIGKDRFEVALTMNKSFVPKDSTAETEFEKGRSLDFSYFFIFDSLYNRVDQNNIIPFFRIGVALGEFDIKDEYKEYYASDNILSTDYRCGVGLFSQLSRQFELHFGYDIIHRSFQTIKESSFSKETLHDTQGISVGANYHF